MKHFSSIVRQAMIVAVAALSFTSCNRAEYASLPQTSAYQVTAHMAVPATPVETPAPDGAAMTAAAPATASATVIPQAKAAKTTTNPLAAAHPKLVKLTRKVEKLTAKATAKRQETAQANQVTSKAGRAAIVAGAGLVLLLLGAAAEVGIIAFIGLLAFIVGVIILIIALINGN